jgi:hypothetical protein
MFERTMDRDHPRQHNTMWETTTTRDRLARMIAGVASLWHTLGTLWQRIELLLSEQVTRPMALQPCRCSTVEPVIYRRRKSQSWE